MKKETFKQYIFRLLENNEKITDQKIYNFRKDFGGYQAAEVYKLEYNNLKYFKDYDFIELKHFNRKYLGKTSDMAENEYIKIPKAVYLKHLSK